MPFLSGTCSHPKQCFHFSKLPYLCILCLSIPINERNMARLWSHDRCFCGKDGLKDLERRWVLRWTAQMTLKPIWWSLRSSNTLAASQLNSLLTAPKQKVNVLWNKWNIYAIYLLDLCVSSLAGRSPHLGMFECHCRLGLDQLKTRHTRVLINWWKCWNSLANLTIVDNGLVGSAKSAEEAGI